jgi:hypothetical protein
MKFISDLTGNALGLCAVAAILSGCGGGSGAAPLPIPAVQTHLNNPGSVDGAASPNDAASEQLASKAANREVLAGKAKLKFGKEGTTFTARGTATGSYPGTFTASGSWESGESNGGHAQWICCPWWIFSEAFTITSGSSSISGRITGMGMDDGLLGNVVSNLELPYSTSIGNGNAYIKRIKQGRFHQTLFGL